MKRPRAQRKVVKAEATEAKAGRTSPPRFLSFHRSTLRSHLRHGLARPLRSLGFSQFFKILGRAVEIILGVDISPILPLLLFFFNFLCPQIFFEVLAQFHNRTQAF